METREEYLADMIARTPGHPERIRIVRQGATTNVTAMSKTFDLRARAGEFGLVPIEGKTFVAIGQYNIATDEQTFLVDRK